MNQTQNPNFPFSSNFRGRVGWPQNAGLRCSLGRTLRRVHRQKVPPSASPYSRTQIPDSGPPGPLGPRGPTLSPLSQPHLSLLLCHQHALLSVIVAATQTATSRALANVSHARTRLKRSVGAVSAPPPIRARADLRPVLEEPDRLKRPILPRTTTSASLADRDRRVQERQAERRAWECRHSMEVASQDATPTGTYTLWILRFHCAGQSCRRSLVHACAESRMSAIRSSEYHTTGCH